MKTLYKFLGCVWLIFGIIDVLSGQPYMLESIMGFVLLTYAEVVT